MNQKIIIFIALIIVIFVIIFLWGYTQSSGGSCGSGSLATASGCEPITCGSDGNFTGSSTS